MARIVTVVGRVIIMVVMVRVVEGRVMRIAIIVVMVMVIVGIVAMLKRVVAFFLAETRSCVASDHRTSSESYSAKAVTTPLVVLSLCVLVNGPAVSRTTKKNTVIATENLR